MTKKDKHLVISCQAVNFHLWATGPESKVVVRVAVTLFPVNTGMGAPGISKLFIKLNIYLLLRHSNSILSQTIQYFALRYYKVKCVHKETCCWQTDLLAICFHNLET